MKEIEGIIDKLTYDREWSIDFSLLSDISRFYNPEVGYNPDYIFRKWLASKSSIKSCIFIIKYQ